MAPLSSKPGLAALAETQGGRLHHQQLTRLGASRDLIRGWVQRGILIRTRLKVYALGYVRSDLVALVWEALLYAGPGAYLTGSSGAHQCQLIREPPRSVIVASPRKCKALPGIVVLSQRPPARDLYARVPVAPLPELMLQLAAEGDYNLVRFALGNLEFRRQLDIAALLTVCGSGRRGSALLRRALAHRLPQLARTRSPLEVAFLLLLDAHHLALPRVNVWLHGILVDTYWPELGLVVELDGKDNHTTAAQRRRDAANDARLRGHGLTVVRLESDDVYARPAVTLGRLRALGVRRSAGAAPRTTRRGG